MGPDTNVSDRCVIGAACEINSRGTLAPDTVVYGLKCQQYTKKSHSQVLPQFSDEFCLIILVCAGTLQTPCCGGNPSLVSKFSWRHCAHIDFHCNDSSYKLASYPGSLWAPVLPTHKEPEYEASYKSAAK